MHFTARSILSSNLQVSLHNRILLNIGKTKHILLPLLYSVHFSHRRLRHYFYPDIPSSQGSPRNPNPEANSPIYTSSPKPATYSYRQRRCNPDHTYQTNLNSTNPKKPQTPTTSTVQPTLPNIPHTASPPSSSPSPLKPPPPPPLPLKTPFKLQTQPFLPPKHSPSHPNKSTKPRSHAPSKTSTFSHLTIVSGNLN